MTRIFDHLHRFATADSGSAAIDWVVMSAATIALTLAVMGEVSDAVEDAATRLGTRLGDMPIRTSFEEWDAFRAEQAAEEEAEDSAETGDET